MFVATLITDPAAPCLDAADAARLSDNWSGRGVEVLAPDTACAFEMDHMPVDLKPVRDEFQRRSIDLVVTPTQNRRKRILLADMDSTIIEQECIDELADEAGVGPQVAEITARAMNGDVNFEDALRLRVGMLKGLPVSTIQSVLEHRITLAPGAETLVATLRANGAFCALVSGGFTAFTAAVAERLGFDTHRANTLVEADGRLTGVAGDPIVDRDAKVVALNDFTAALKLSANDVLAVGDGANDLGMLNAAGLGVAMHAKPLVQMQTDIAVNHGDLTALLYIQGYCMSEFVNSV